MLIKQSTNIRSHEITGEQTYLDRRRFMRNAARAGLATGLLASLPLAAPAAATPMPARLEGIVKGPFGTDEELTPYEDVTSYNNFYEFGADKTDPAVHSQNFKTRPWSVEISGECDKPGVYDLEDLVKPNTLEERVYRLRCVEAWSMVIPWVGFPLAPVLRRFQPTSNAKFVAFQTVHAPEQMPGQRTPILDWPYVEGLRIDEAMHPLTILAVGLYGKELPNQNGAPLRLVVPWKYGFKSIKSIVGIRFTRRQPPTSWNLSAPKEYGFYANVNPNVDHPRWSQARERRLGGGAGSLWFLVPKQDTLMFNGYGDQVASLYAGTDLREHY